MNATERPSVTIEHELPGRLRVRLSHTLKHPDRLHRMIQEHPGVARVQYTAPTRSVLVRYDLQSVSAEEIVIRIAISLALEKDKEIVRILTRPPTREVTDNGFYAGLALLVALAARVLRPGRFSGPVLDGVAGLVTAGAVLEHGWQEYRRQGNFDPEVLTVTYLLTALLRGKALSAALFTWITTFGRHLARLPGPGVEVRLVEIGGEGGMPQVEVVVAPDRTPPDKMTFFAMLPTLMFNALTKTSPGHHASLLDDIQRVAKLHHQVLEGVGGFQPGIPLRIRHTHTGWRTLPRATS